MSVVYTILSLIVAILQVILFFKIWRACDDLRTIKENVEAKKVTSVRIEAEERDEYANMDKMIALSMAGEVSQSQLFLFIYEDLMSSDSRYHEVQAKWKALCEKKGWIYPAELDVNSTEFYRCYKARYV